MTLSLHVDSADVWTAALTEANGLGPDYRIGPDPYVSRSVGWTDEPEHGDRLSILARSRNATLSLVNAYGQIVSSVRYDLSATAQRDMLFRKAWTQAEKLSSHPTQCEPTADRSPIP